MTDRDRALPAAARAARRAARGAGRSLAGLQGISLRAGINTGDALVIFETAGDEEPELEIDLPASIVQSTPRGVSR